MKLTISSPVWCKQAILFLPQTQPAIDSGKWTSSAAERRCIETDTGNWVTDDNNANGQGVCSHSQHYSGLKNQVKNINSLAPGRFE